MTTLTRAQVSEIDRRAIEDYGVPGVVLMENAGRGVAEVLLRLGVTGPVHIVCGKGNNGGDGFVIARHLDLHRLDVTVHRCGAEADITGDALVHYRVLAPAGIRIEHYTTPDQLADHLRHADWIIDALFGTGLLGPPRPPGDVIIGVINASGAKVLAVDLPSGLDADTGETPGPTVRADHTVTFVAPKRGFTAARVSHWLGQVHVVPIGAPRNLLDQYSVNG